MPKDKELDRELRDLQKTCKKLSAIGGNHDINNHLNTSFKEFMGKYYKWLPKDTKMAANKLDEEYRKTGLIEDKIGLDQANSVQIYWEFVKKDAKKRHSNYTQIFQFFEENSKRIKNENLGGPKSLKSKAFNEELNNLKAKFAQHYKFKDNIIKEQIRKSPKLDKMLKEKGISIISLFEQDIL